MSAGFQCNYIIDEWKIDMIFFNKAYFLGNMEN